MRKIIQTKDAPAPVGPYNQAISVGNLVFVSGQIALDPDTGALLTDDLDQEVHRVMQNINAVLMATDLGLEHIVKCTIFVKDMNQYGAINAIYATYFKEEVAPARELVEVARLPKDVNIEISVIASRH